MNCRERILKTLDHDEPDKVPYWEHLIEQPKLLKKIKFEQNESQESKRNDNHNKLPDLKNKTLIDHGYELKIIIPLIKGANGYFKL